MKRTLILIFSVFNFAACESSNEEPNPFEGKPAEEVLEEEGGIDYLISRAQPADASMIDEALKSGKVLYNDFMSYRIVDGKWMQDARSGDVDQYMVSINDSTLRSCYEIESGAFFEGNWISKVYWDFAPIPDAPLAESVWSWWFYGPTDSVEVTTATEIIGHVDNMLFVTYTDYYGNREGELIRICDNRDEILSLYGVDRKNCTEQPE